MDLTAKEATVLTLLAAQPSTRLYERLLQKLDNPRVRALAAKIREGAETETDASESTVLTVPR